MGDVFKAMSRGKREQHPAAPSDSWANPEPGQAPGAESPALPIDQVDAKPLVSEEAETGAGFGLADRPSIAPATQASRPISDQPVAAAVERAAAEPDQRFQTALPTRSAADARLNGYAPDVVVHHDRGCVITEQYRAIRTQILARARNRRMQTFVVTSSAPSEGKSVSTINLGVAFSELRNKKTLLVEADLRRPSFPNYFARKDGPGLIQFLRGEVQDFQQVIQPTVYDNLQFIPAGGNETQHSTELLSSPRMAMLLDRLKDHYDFIFIDTPPVITVTDACILGAMADQTMLVVRLNRTPSDIVDRAKRLLRASNCEIAGVILTHLTYEMPRYLYRYDRYYGYK